MPAYTVTLRGQAPAPAPLTLAALLRSNLTRTSPEALQALLDAHRDWRVLDLGGGEAPRAQADVVTRRDPQA